MKNLLIMILVVLGSLLLLLGAVINASAQFVIKPRPIDRDIITSKPQAPSGGMTQDWTYNQPRYGGDRLDWCLTWGVGCGREAAVAFCNRNQYEDVVVFRAEVVGKSARTRLLGSSEVCDGQDFCTAFAYITCTKPIRYDRVFANPKWNGYRLDACLEGGTGCGKPAADAFCRTKRFSESLSFAMDQTAGRGATRLIGTDQICDKPFCVGFQQITCK